MTTEDIHQASTDAARQLDFVISARDDSEFVLYDDDGHTRDFERGLYSRTKINVKSGEKTVISFKKEGRYEDTVENYTFKVVSRKKGALLVGVDGARIKRYLIRENLDAAASGWYYDLSERSVIIKCPKPKKDAFEIVVSFEKFDLIGMAEED